MRDLNNFFTAEDFDELVGHETTWLTDPITGIEEIEMVLRSGLAAKLASQLLREHIEKNGSRLFRLRGTKLWSPVTTEAWGSTHCGTILDVKEIRSEG